MRSKVCKDCGKDLPWYATSKQCAVCAVKAMGK
jgi:hypothetical protein